jgi:hypothetical protein
MTSREARKIVTVVEASYLIQADTVAGPNTSEKELREAKWLARSLLRRYGLKPGDIEPYNEPEAIRRAILSGDL